MYRRYHLFAAVDFTSPAYGVGNDNAIEYRFGSSRDIDIKNNLTDAAIRAREGATGTLAGNVTNAAISLFVSPTAGNLHLVRNASVINQGVPLSDVTTDIDGDSRDNTLNVGADE